MNFGQGVEIKGSIGNKEAKEDSLPESIKELLKEAVESVGLNAQRAKCLEFAVKMQPHSAEDAIQIAEKFLNYIMKGAK